jgi:hypothetical protein
MDKHCGKQPLGDRLFPIYFLIAVIVMTASASSQEIMRFAVIGDYGSGDRNQENVANLVKSWNPDFVITTGDNNYPDGETATIDNNIGKFYSQFIYPYNGSYGSGATFNRFFPAMGNHDWDNNVGYPSQPYMEYFTLPGNERYYDFVQGPVHFFMLDSDSREPDGITSTSVQANWLRAKLASSTAQWKIVVMHHPPFSSRTSWPKLQWPFKEWGASVVLSGHAHVYERIIKNGLPFITNGLGGDSTGSFGTALEGSVVRFGSEYGAGLVRVSATSITFQFITRGGQIIDTYTMGPDAGSPAAPTNLAATALNNGQSTLTWTDNALNEDGYRIERSVNGGSFLQIGSTIADVTTFVAGGLTVGNLYSFRVRAVNNAGVSAYSNIAEPSGGTSSAPTAPSNLSVTAASATQLNLTWTDTSSNESGFSIERCQGASCTDFSEIVQTSAGINTYQDGGRSAVTTYRYRVRAFNGIGTSGYSNIASGTTLASGGPTEPPANLRAVATSVSSIALSWTDDSDNEDGFKVERCDGAGCINFAEIARPGANTTTFNDTSLSPQTSYSYRVRAFAGSIDTAYSNTAQATTLSMQSSSLTDDFNDGTRDSSKWNIGILSRSSSNFDAAITVFESGGLLTISPRANISGSHYNGYISAISSNLNGGYAAVELVQAAANSAVSLFTIGLNKDNWYSFRIKGATVYLERRISGSTTSTTIKYDPLQHRFFRFRHNTANDSIIFETSGNGSVWTGRSVVPRQIALSSVSVELAAGTATSISNPGAARFDNLLLVSN